jgi:hypothetical protein
MAIGIVDSVELLTSQKVKLASKMKSSRPASSEV